MSVEKFGTARSPVDDIVQRGLTGRLFAGAVIRAEKRGEVFFEKAYGYALDTPGEKIAMAPDTRFDIASVTKLFTTTAVLRLVTEGRLPLSGALCDIEPFSAWARENERIGRAFSSITVEKLLTHASGLHYWYPFYADGGGRFEEILARVLERFPVKNEVIYSDINFMLLGKAVEAAAGEPLDTAVANLVCGPLGLGESGYRPGRKPAAAPFAATEFGNRVERKMVEDLGLSYAGWRRTDVPIVGEPDDGNCHYYFGGVAGHAGVFSTARDLCALGRLYLDGGTLPAKGKERGARHIAENLALDAGIDHGSGRGLGFQCGELYPRGGFGHTGFTGTYLYLNREMDLAIAVLANRLHVEIPQNINAFRKEIVDTLIRCYNRAY